MILFPILFVLSRTQSTSLYVWSESEEGAVRVREGSKLPGVFPDESIIMLSVEEDFISIDLVQKGTGWPIGSSFCSALLPAAMSDFISQKGISLEDISFLIVFNSSVPFRFGCKCYLRLFVSMGFQSIGSYMIRNEEEIEAYCGAPDVSMSIVGEQGEYGVSSPSYTPEAKLLLESAYKFSY